MPKRALRLDEAEMKRALLFWVDMGCPDHEPERPARVSMHHVDFSGSADPREQSYFYAEVGDQ